MRYEVTLIVAVNAQDKDQAVLRVNKAKVCLENSLAYCDGSSYAEKAELV